MKKFFDVLFYLLFIYFCIELYNGNYISKIIEISNKIETQEKKNDFYRKKIKKMSNEVSDLKNQLNNLELYIYKKNKERTNE